MAVVVEERVKKPRTESWVFRELGHTDFGDARLTARALVLATDLSRHPDLSLASMYEGEWDRLKAGYRFLDNPSVTPAAIHAPHREATWQRWAGLVRVLIAQDTTYFNFTAHPATQGPMLSG